MTLQPPGRPLAAIARRRATYGALIGRYGGSSTLLGQGGHPARRKSPSQREGIPIVRGTSPIGGLYVRTLWADGFNRTNRTHHVRTYACSDAPSSLAGPEPLPLWLRKEQASAAQAGPAVDRA